MIGKKEEQEASNLRPLYRHEKEQKCFIGHTYNASWRAVIAELCDEVLPTFGLRPWYADAQFDPTTSLREKVVEMIKNTPYGIYDLSYWRANEQGSWQMPRNVLIELGMAIALNRPTLLLRHTENRVAGLALPDCLQSVESSFCEFTGGKKSLRDALATHLPQCIKRSPEQEWHNRYCLFGNMVCDYRDSHPLSPHTIQKKIACHIADGQDTDRDDFRASVEEIIERFDSIGYSYINAYSLPHGYNFSLCSQCQLVRSTPFAIYRLTAQTPAEVFIMIGMSIALEKQFGYKIPKILLTEKPEYVPSLLGDNEFVVIRNDRELRARLTKLLPQVIQRARETMWRPQALPFEVHLPSKDTYSDGQNEELLEKEQLLEIPPQREKKAIKLFISYAREDEKLRDELMKHLGREHISGWYDREIYPRMDWENEIDANLEQADIVLLLISSDFKVSDYCSGKEMKRALEREKEKNAYVIPIMMRPVHWPNPPFRHLQIPNPGRPVTVAVNRDQAFTDIATQIHQVIDTIISRS